MGDLVLFNTVLTMTSQEIADLVEARHDNVKRSIETLGLKGVISLPQLEDAKIQRERRTETVGVYRLDKRSSLIVVAQLCPEFTARMVDRWQELEQAANDPMRLLNNPDYLRGALLTYTEKVIQLEKTVNEQTPKVLAFEQIKGAHGALCFRDTAKTLHVKEQVLKAWLLAHRWAYCRPGKGRLIGTSEAIAKGYVNHKLTTRTFDDGSIEEYSQLMFTPRGVAKLAIEMSKRESA